MLDGLSSIDMRGTYYSILSSNGIFFTCSRNFCCVDFGRFKIPAAAYEVVCACVWSSVITSSRLGPYRVMVANGHQPGQQGK